jgi:hypothetical protein
MFRRVALAFLFATFATIANAQTKVVYIFAGTTWTVPADWNSANNKIEAIGGGAGGGFGTNGSGHGGPGGGGGAYTYATNVTLTPGATIPVSVGAGGIGSYTTIYPGAGGTTTFNTNTVIAVGGAGELSGSPLVGGLGGAASACTPAGNAYSGGNGGTVSGTVGAGAGGGGSAGPHGNGAAGGANASGNGGSGGGAADGGGAGVAVSAGGAASAGGTAYNSSAGGAGGGSGAVGLGGTNGAGSGGGGLGTGATGGAGGIGSAGIDYTQTINAQVAGPGGGGGGGALSTTVGGGNGGYAGGYGAGAGGSAENNSGNNSAGGYGGDGLIIVTYVSTGASSGTVSGTFSGVYTLNLAPIGPQGSSITVSVTSSAPTQAAAVGYNTNTFSTNAFTTSNVDTTASYGSTFQWYPFNFFGASGAITTMTINGDASITVAATSPSSNGIGTAYYITSAPQQWKGTAFGGGFYAEWNAKFNSANVQTVNGWPSMWSLTIEDLANRPGQYWPGQAGGYLHYYEADLLEYFQNSANQPYISTLHEYSNIYPSVVNYSATQTSTFTDYNNYHKYALLWVPATASNNGYIKYYRDGVQTGSTVSWTQYTSTTDTPPPSATTPWAFGIVDALHLVPLMSAGTEVGGGLTVSSFNIWQANATQNITN